MNSWAKKTKLNLVWYKIPDAATQYTSTHKRFVDVIASCNGTFLAIEWKLMKSKRGFPIRSIADNQIDVLSRVADSGGLGYLAIAQWLSRTEKNVFMIPVNKWIQAVEQEERKSIRLQDIFSSCMIGKRSSQSFDFTALDRLFLERMAYYDERNST